MLRYLLCQEDARQCHFKGCHDIPKEQGLLERLATEGFATIVFGVRCTQEFCRNMMSMEAQQPKFSTPKDHSDLRLA